MDTGVDCTKCPGITISRAVGNDRGEKGRLVRVLSGMVGFARYGVHNASMVNLCRGVVERVLYTRKDGVLSRPASPVAGVFKRLRSIRSAVLRNTRSTNVVDIEDYPSLYHCARKRAVYERAVASLRTWAVNSRDAIVSTFVKAEKVNFSAKGDPAPRVIQPRNPRYNVCVGRFLKPFEKNIYAGFERTLGYTVICKGLNASGTASVLREDWEAYNDPVAIGLDASRFDQHVSREALEYEHGFYNAIFRSSELAELLTWQLRNKGVGFADGQKIKYEVDGCRMSGDINTSLGNCIIMSSIVLAYFTEHGVDARLANNGDDCVVFCDRKTLPRLDGIDEWFSEFGFVLTREAVVDEFERVEFCQAQPVLTSTGWRMVRNPFTATSKDMVSLLSWNTEIEFDRWRGAIGSCGLSLTIGVPYWEAFYRRLGGSIDERSVEAIRDSGLGYMAKGVVGDSRIGPETRYSFWRAFGLLPDEQMALESIVVDIDYSQLGPLTFGDVRPLSELLRVSKPDEVSDPKATRKQ